ncbi:hypothetical protein MXD62_37370 [Frankia sp. Mgl5]|uniref:hypothetical protein n=1 Tax=Frankia sp. Mgl5 TaxID=2933793 RepID=UPI00200D5816|nr:hypothetical protein [Frankia sp. Mgl5]MCK9932747.1 hypothetical protein [Frankia sp. Mgl5]
MSRPFHVYDYEGEHLGSFATWDLAHEWAHLQAMLNGVPTPLQVEDRSTTGRRRVWADRCEPLDGPTGGGALGGDLLDDDLTGGDVLAGGPCSAAATPVFAPPLPRQPSEPADSALTEAGLAEAGLAEG